MLLLTMANDQAINTFLRKRFHAKEIYTVQMAVDFLKDYEIQAIVLSEFTGTEEVILGAVSAIRQASPVKIIYIGRDISESLGKALLRAGVLILEGEFTENQLVALVEQDDNAEAVRRFAVATGETIEAEAASFIRQRIISVIGAPGAGKSLFSNCLARVIAQGGVKTLLVDVANFPMQHVYFSIKDKHQARNITLYGINPSAQLKDHLVEAASNLFLLPGAVTTWGEPKVSSTRMNKLIQEAKDQFDVIIFDCSPFINEEITDDAVRASRDVFMITTADLPGLHNATRLMPFVPEGSYWVQNRYMGLDANQLYMAIVKRSSPVARIPEIDSYALASAVAKGKPHPIMLKAAKEIAIKVLGIQTQARKSKGIPFIGRKADAQTSI